MPLLMNFDLVLTGDYIEELNIKSKGKLIHRDGQKSLSVLKKLLI